MSTRKPPAKKAPAKKTWRQRAGETFTEISNALNPVRRATPAAQRQMEAAKERYGGGARRRRIDAVVDDAVEGRQPRRRSR